MFTDIPGLKPSEVDSIAYYLSIVVTTKWNSINTEEAQGTMGDYNDLGGREGSLNMRFFKTK